MVPDLTLEVIYLNGTTDFKMEFDICGCANIRFLSHITHSRAQFLAALSKGVVRSRVIIVVGSFNPLDADYLPSIISKATGFVEKTVDTTAYNMPLDTEYALPERAIPLITKGGVLGGCVLENNDQSIIMLTADRDIRHELLSFLVCPYLKMLVGKVPTAQEINETNTNKIETKSITAKELAEQKPKEQNTSEPKMAEQVNEAPISTESSEEDANSSIMLKTGKNGEGFVVLEQPENYEENKLPLDYIVENEERPHKKPRKALKSIVAVLLVLLVLLSAFFGYKFVYQPMHYQRVLAEIASLYGRTWDKLPENMNYKFGMLYKTNDDVVGWLSIPETNISFPVVSSKGKPDNFYKNHLFEGTISTIGTPYTHCEIEEDTYSRNVIIYGKGDGENSAFSDLKSFLSEEKYKNSLIFTFDTLFLEQRFKIVAVYSETNSKKPDFETAFFDDTAFLNYVEKVKEKSQITTNIDVTSSDELVTVVSEEKGSRTVIVGRKVRTGEMPMVDLDSNPTIELPNPSDTSSTESSPLQEIVDTSSNPISSEPTSSKAPQNTDRFEQEAPTSSYVEITPTPAPTIPNVDGTAPSVPPLETLNLPTLTIKNTLTGDTLSLPANEAVAMVVEAEMGSHFHEEALKAQAVAAYSWLLANGAASGSVPSAPMKTAGARAVSAANSVAGVVALYEGKVIQTYYFPISAGKTADSSSIWSAQLPYLKSVDSSVDKNADKFQTIKTYSASELAARVKAAMGVDLTKIADKSRWFSCTYDSSGVYVKTINIGGAEKKGTYMRTNILNYEIRSSAYTISYNKIDDKFTLVVKGYGHGVGMSQVGANYYAQNGLTYVQILKHYYTGIELGIYTN